GTGPAHVDARDDVGRAPRVGRAGEDQVAPAGARPGLEGRGQLVVLELEQREARFAVGVVAVDVEHHDPATRAHADVRVGPPRPPALDGGLVGARLLHAAPDPRVLAGAVAVATLATRAGAVGGRVQG